MIDIDYLEEMACGKCHNQEIYKQKIDDKNTVIYCSYCGAENNYYDLYDEVEAEDDADYEDY